MKKIFEVISIICCSSLIVIAQWQQTAGPIGGNVKCFTESNNNIYAGSNGGVFKSTNFGANWLSINNGLQNFDVRSIASKGDTLYVGCIFGIYRSTNGGVNWQYSALQGSTSINILIFNNIIFTNTLSELHISTNWGNSWNMNPWPYQTIECFYVIDNIIFAGTGGSGIYKSSDLGVTWSAANNGLNNLFIHSITANGSILFAGSSGGGIFKSSDNGNNWITVNNGISFFNIIAIYSVNNNIYASAYGGGVYISSDNGNSWNTINTGLEDLHVNDFVSSGNSMFAGTIANGIYTSTNNGQLWETKNNGIWAHGINEIIVKDNFIFSGTVYGGIFRSSDNGISWIEMNNGINYDWYCNAFLNTGINLFTGVESGIYSTTDNGFYWTNIGLPQYNINCFEMLGNNVFAGTNSHGLFLSTDMGSSWQLIGFDNESIFKLLVKENILFASTTQGLFSTTNNGFSWNLIDQNFSPFSFTINNDVIYAGFFGVRKSTNNGISWSLAGLNGKVINSLISIDSFVIAGTSEIGVQITSNKGSSWTDISQGLIDKHIKSFTIKDDFIYAGTAGSSIWKRPLSDIIGVKNVSTSIPEDYFLFQNYPNPFNPVTRIKFSISHTPLFFGEGQGVRLSIFDILGREVAVLVNEQLRAGTYEVDFDGANYPSGVYFYKLTTVDASAPLSITKKMVLIK
jgi:photosystem II stability/assembly factor-like uncharacterized protein